jgi:hypothetical protein
MKFIDFKFYDKSLIYYIAIVLVIAGHGIHFTELARYRMSLQVMFILGYLLLILNNIIYDGKIHISTLIYRTILICILLYIINL